MTALEILVLVALAILVVTTLVAARRLGLRIRLLREQKRRRR